MHPRYRLTRILNILAILLLSCVLIGAYIYQFTYGLPCPLCELQRLAMISASLGFMLNLRYGIHPRHYAITLASCIFGGSVSLRQIGLHICPGFPIFGVRIFDFELYTWAFLVFGSTLMGLFLLMICYKNEDSDLHPKVNVYEKIVMGLMFILMLSNAVTTFLLGMSP